MRPTIALEQLSLAQAVLAYRDQQIIEGSLGRLKGRQHSLTPLYLGDDRREVGLIPLLVIALRLLCVYQFVACRLPGRSRNWERASDQGGVCRTSLSRAPGGRGVRRCWKLLRAWVW